MPYLLALLASRGLEVGRTRLAQTCGFQRFAGTSWVSRWAPAPGSRDPAPKRHGRQSLPAVVFLVRRRRVRRGLPAEAALPFAPPNPPLCLARRARACATLTAMTTPVLSDLLVTRCTAAPDCYVAAQHIMTEHPHTSAKELCELLEQMGHRVPEGRRDRRLLRQSAREGARMPAPTPEAPRSPVDAPPAPPPAPAPPAAPEAHSEAPEALLAQQNLQAALVAGDAQGAGQWARVLASLASLGPRGAEPAALEDFRALSDRELECLGALTAIADRRPLSDSEAWWRALIARVPAPPDRPHPAHLELPSGSPFQAKLLAK